MARNDDRDRIATVSQAHRAKRSRRADQVGDLAVRSGCSVRNRQQSFPNPALERRSDQIKFDVEFSALAVKILTELLDCVEESIVVAHPTLLTWFMGLINHQEMHQAATFARQGQRSDGTVDGSELHYRHHLSLTGGQAFTEWSSAVHRCCVA